MINSIDNLVKELDVDKILDCIGKNLYGNYTLIPLCVKRDSTRTYKEQKGIRLTSITSCGIDVYCLENGNLYLAQGTYSDDWTVDFSGNVLNGEYLLSENIEIDNKNPTEIERLQNFLERHKYKISEHSEKNIYFGSKISTPDENDLSGSVADEYLGPHIDNPWMMSEEDLAEFRKITNPW